MTSAQVVEISVTTTDKDYTITCYPRIQTINVNLKVYINSFLVFTSFFAVFSRVSRLTQTKVTLICQSTQAYCIIVANVHPALVLVKKNKKNIRKLSLKNKLTNKNIAFVTQYLPASTYPQEHTDGEMAPYSKPTHLITS